MGHPIERTNHKALNQSTICHPDRSVAEWRDLQFLFSALGAIRPPKSFTTDPSGRIGQPIIRVLFQGNAHQLAPRAHAGLLEKLL
jgi:hypothetical protein